MPPRATDSRISGGAGVVVFGVVAILATGILLVAVPAALVIAKWICDPIAHATSGGAVLFTLLFVAGSTLAIRRRHAGSFDPAGWKLAATLLSALVIGNAANLAAHVCALRSMNLPASAPIYRWNGAENTYS